MTAHPVFSGGVGFAVQAPGGLPQVLHDMNEVADDNDGEVAGGCFGVDPVDLMDVAVHQRHPDAGVMGVAAFGFVEDPGDHRCGVLHDAGHQPLVGGGGPVLGGLPLDLAGGEDVAGSARHRGRVVDRTEFGEAFAVPLLAFAQPGAELVAFLGSGFRGRRA